MGYNPDNTAPLEYEESKKEAKKLITTEMPSIIAHRLNFA